LKDLGPLLFLSVEVIW